MENYAGDIIVNTNYHDILNFHLKNKNDITLVVAKKSFYIPYGVCGVDKKNSKFTEKPKFNFKINVGLYLLSKNILDLVKKRRYLDFNVLFSKCVKKNVKISKNHKHP